MRTPERCPWCGADRTEGEASPYWGDEDYRCGAVMVDGEWLCTCPDHDTPSAAAFRQVLAWRKRLSQHTGVPLRMVPEPAIMRHGTAMWPAARIELALAGPGRWGILAWGPGIGWVDRAEARRRLLAKEGE